MPRVFECSKTTNKYIIIYRDVLVYIMAKFLMQTLADTKVVGGQKLKRQSMRISVKKCSLIKKTEDEF